VLPLITSLLGQTAISGAATRDLMRAQPVERAAGKRGKALVEAFAKRSKDLAGDKAPVKIAIKQNVAPTGQQIADAFEAAQGDPAAMKQAVQLINPMHYASNISDYSKGADGKLDILHGERLPATVVTNPNADEAYFAHELGHTLTTNTKVGDAIRRIRDFSQANPKAALALAMAGGLTPAVAAALTPGDDDLDEAILGSIALTAPTLIDEGLATKNALAIMEASGQRANFGQRARLAGGLLSYMAAPIVTGTAANTFGNIFDEDV